MEQRDSGCHRSFFQPTPRLHRSANNSQLLPQRENVPVFLSNQSKLFEGGFEVVDDFLGDDVRYDLREMGPDTFISSVMDKNESPIEVHVTKN